MDADQLLALLGRSADDPSVESAFVELQTRRRPELDPEDRDAFYDWVLVRREGVEMGFVDEVYFQAGEKWKRRRKNVPLILRQLYFYTQRDDVADFTGRLPFGLEWSDDRNIVRHKLSAVESTGRLYLKDVWHVGAYQMTIDYKKDSDVIDSIVCQLPLAPLPEEGRVQVALKVDDWLPLFGLPASSPALREGLQPLNLVDRVEETNDEREIDFRFECGLNLSFTEATDSRETKRIKKLAGQKRKGLVLCAAGFFRRRYLDAREWSGEVPLGLFFDDSQQTMLEKVGRDPDEQEDDDFEGYALWHFPEFSLHVLYNNMENHLLRVTLMALGS